MQASLSHGSQPLHRSCNNGKDVSYMHVLIWSDELDLYFELENNFPSNMLILILGS